METKINNFFTKIVPSVFQPIRYLPEAKMYYVIICLQPVPVHYYTNSYWHWSDYWKLFPHSWKYSPRPNDEGNISHRTVSQYSPITSVTICFVIPQIIPAIRRKQVHQYRNNDVMCTVSQKMHKLWNGIARNYTYQFWWNLAWMFKRF